MNNRCLLCIRDFLLTLLILVLANTVLAQSMTSRFALVIGNSSYSHMPKLKNPVNDARDLADALKNLGFSVTLLVDVNRKAMNQAIVAFREVLSEDRQSEGVFFFAGHGIQLKGINYLIPLGADIKADVDLEDEAVSVSKILSSLEEAHDRVNLVILDACRDNPLPTSVRNATRGLAVVGAAPADTIILYSTAAGQTAFDGLGRNSPFAKAVLSHLADAGDITMTIKQIIADVKGSTGGQQTPYLYSDLTIDFALNSLGYSNPAASTISVSAFSEEASSLQNTPGIVFDPTTNLDWLAGPDRDMSWEESLSWINNISLGTDAWRMPTLYELRTIFEKGTGIHNIKFSLINSGHYIWASDTKDSSSAWYFDFDNGSSYWAFRSHSYDNRVLAVKNAN